MTTDKFYHLYKRPEAHTKVQPSKLPYLAHNTCSVITWPPWYVWSTRPTQCWSDPADASSRLLCTDVPMCHVQIVKLPGVLHSTELGIAMCVRCRPQAKIIGNARKWSEKVGKGHVTSVAYGTITWSSANGVKMRKYVNSKLWSSSLQLLTIN
jgi:hypothetical protein